MRSTRFRVALFALLVAGVGVTLVSAPTGAVAQPVPAPPVAAGEPAAKEPIIDKLSFPENRDTNRKFEALVEYLAAKAPKWREITELAQGMLDAKSDYFYQFPDGDKRRVSVKDEVSRMIGKFPKEGLEFYQLTYGPLAEGMLQRAKEAGYDKGVLAEVAQRYFHTKAGGQAALLLAALNLDTGNYSESAYGYQKLLARPDADALLDPKTLFRAAVAVRRAGDGKMTDAVAEVWARLEKKFPAAGLQIGRKAYSLDTLKAELDRPVEMLFGAVGDQFVAMKGGNPTRAAQAEAGAPFLSGVSWPVLYRVESDEQMEAAKWVKACVDQAYKQAKNKQMAPLLPAVFPVTAPNMIVFRGYDGVYAFYTKDFRDATGKARRAGDLAWHQLGKFGAAAIREGKTDDADSPASDKTNLETWWGNYWAGNQPSVLFENPLAGSLSHDGKRVYFVDDFHIPPAVLQVNYDGWGGRMPQDTARGVGKREYNRLVALDLESGVLNWVIGRGPTGPTKSEDEDKISSAAVLAEGAYFLGPPVTLNGKLYVLLERDGHLKLACLDPYKESEAPPAVGRDGQRAKNQPKQRQPELLWVQNLGRANSPVRQDPVRRIQGAFLAAADGVVVCPTNSGAVVAVDLNARSLLWAHTYATLDKGQEVGGEMGIRRIPRYPTPNQNGQNRWRSSGPIIVGQRVVVAAYDSGTVQCVDLRTGKLHWQENRKPDDLYVGGVLNDAVLIVGRNAMRAVKLTGDRDDKTGREKPTLAWKEELKIAAPVGHGVAGKDGLFYLPVVGDPDKPDDQTPAVWAVNAATGKVTGKTQYRRKDGAAGPGADPRLVLGNLVFHDGMMYSQSATEVAAFQLNEVKQREMDALLAGNPNDPAGLTSRGELKLERGELTKAVQDFKTAQANKPDEVTAHKIRQKLYTAYTEILRDKFADGEAFLAEYKQLCEVPIDPDAPDAGRQKDEQVRRLGLYYSLVAKGREGQGRLVDAFDNYRAYAELGEKDKLLPVPEDPNTSALSRVWASGRIDAMMKNAKDPAVRKPLEDRVAKDWAEVQGANDLNRLRKFVTVFGPYFASGREAQFLLADRLSATNNDDDRREAQGLLLALVAQSEEDRDAATAARATAALARLLTSRGLLDDALGLYNRLAARYPDVVVQGAKTGGDLLGELITDKQYWPALEPERPVTLTRYVAKAEGGSSARYAPASLGLNPEGDLLPFFKRHRVSLDADSNSNNTLSLVLTDRVSGEVKYKANTGVMPFVNWGYNYQHPNGTMANQRMAQVSGHLLLLHLERWVICYDLSKGAELWKVNVAAQNGVQANPNTSVQIQQDGASDKDMTVTLYWYNPNTGQQFTDWSWRVGRSAVLQADYAAVLTRDGLVCKDPRTGTVLWQRGGLTQGAMISGDSRHVFLVEPTQTGSTARVLRAVDGVQVPGVPEFGSLLSGSARVHAFGRQVLLFESGGKDKPRTLRLYDILDGKDVWAKKYPAESVVFDTVDPELTGVVSADGKIGVVASRTGKTLFEGAVDAKRAKDHVLDDKGKFAVVKPLLLADADRFFVLLNRDYSRAAVNGQTAENWGPSPNRVKLANGPAYAFSRATGERLWYTDTQFVNQRLLVERFDELPCLIAFNPVHTEDAGPPGGGPVMLGGPGFRGGGVPGATHRIVVVDKQNGALREDKGLPGGNGWFQFFSFDKTNGSYELGGYNNAKLRIYAPTDGKK
jgi:outer membrane protein assembly factor BamB